MAFDALRLRNVIQLVGILRASPSAHPLTHVSPLRPVFHLALMVMAALQVHQTRTALVTMSAADCASNFDEVVRGLPGHYCFAANSP